MKRIVTIQDISCVGKCSLTVALPIISAMGIESAIIPTAVLSTHTGFKNFTFHDLTGEISKITSHWKEQNIGFDGTDTPDTAIGIPYFWIINITTCVANVLFHNLKLF